MAVVRREPADDLAAARREIERLRAEMAQAREREQRLARLTGLAPLTADSVHSMGNLLFTLGIALHLIDDRVRHSRVGRLRDVAALLHEHAADLPGFFASDPRARDIEGYLTALAAQLEADNTALLGDCAAGVGAINQLRGLMTLQARLWPDGPELTTAKLADLVDEAIEFVVRPKDGIQVERHYAPLPRVVLDGRLVRMVVFNLIGNARHLLRTMPAGARHLTVEIEARQPDRLTLVVRDSGPGFTRAAARRIGRLGYSTRPGGRGIGLFSCNVALAEVGGRLSWSSEGAGLGATFTAVLPCQPENGA